MRYRPLGQSGIEASAVALGAWAIGGWMWGGQEEADSIRAIHAALDAGMNLIDTAPIYGFGRSERVVGKALQGRRDQAIIATKVGMVWDTDQGEEFFTTDEEGISREDSPRPGSTAAPGKRRVHKYLGPESLRREVEQSLHRLATDRIDLIQTHWQDPTTPIEDTMAELLRLRDQGKVRAIGVCNATPEHMDRYRAAGPLDSDQEKYSMLDRDIEGSQLPYCREHGVAMLAYSPLANGLLTGKIGPDRTFGPGDLRTDRPRFSVENRQRVAELLADLRPVADRHGITFAQLAIAWTIHQAGVTHALVGARSEKQARENAAAGDVHLTDDDLRAIDAALDAYAPQIV